MWSDRFEQSLIARKYGFDDQFEHVRMFVRITCHLIKQAPRLDARHRVFYDDVSLSL